MAYSHTFEFTNRIWIRVHAAIAIAFYPASCLERIVLRSIVFFGFKLLDIALYIWDIKWLDLRDNRFIVHVKRIKRKTEAEIIIYET